MQFNKRDFINLGKVYTLVLFSVSPADCIHEDVWMASHFLLALSHEYIALCLLSPLHAILSSSHFCQHKNACKVDS